MNSLERVSLTLQHKEADRIPVYPLINSISRKTLGITYEEWTKDVDQCAEAIIKATDELDVDCICTLVDLSVEAADWGAEMLYFDDQAACPVHDNRVIQSDEDYEKITIINPRKTPRMSEHIALARKLFEARGDVKPIVGFVFGPLGILGMLRGHDCLFMDLMMYPDKVHSALRNITETLKEFIRGLVEAGCHAIMLDTLFASKSIMSKAMWDEFEGFYVEELADVIRECGAMVMIHNCGNGVYFDIQIKRMDPVLISYMHIPDDCESMEDIKVKYGESITLMGHIEPGWLMIATKEELEKACKEQIDVYKKNGGFILATGCEYPASIDFEHAKTMVNIAKTHGQY